MLRACWSRWIRPSVQAMWAARIGGQRVKTRSTADQGVLRTATANRPEGHTIIPRPPTGRRQRRRTDFQNHVGPETDAREGPVKVKKQRSTCPVLGLVPTVAWDGRPPVLGLVALWGVPARLLLCTGARSPHGRLRTESHSRAFLPRQQASCLAGNTSSDEDLGVLRLCLQRQTLCCGVER